MNKRSSITKKKYMTKLFLLFFLLSSCQNSETQNSDIINSQFKDFDNSNFFQEVSMNGINYEVFSDYEKTANQLQLQNFDNTLTNTNILNSDAEFNSFLIPTLIGIATLIAVSSSNTGYNNSSGSDNIDMESEWIE